MELCINQRGARFISVPPVEQITTTAQKFQLWNYYVPDLEQGHEVRDYVDYCIE